MVLFTSWSYVLLLCISVSVFYLVKKRTRPLILALSGMIFYFMNAGWFIFLIIAEARAYFLVKSKKRSFFILSILISVGLLVYFKYRFLFFDLAKENVIIPLAISFFTFEFIHYLVDGYQGKIENPNLRDHFAFIFFFPTMVAGPIKRYQEFVPQIYSSSFSLENLLNGSFRILMGLVKKIVLADTLALFSDQLLSVQYIITASPLDIFIRILAYSFKIYLDFSGYSDIALGSAALFGIYLPENFKWPYLARNIADFWRRWHISLTSWFMDYVYKPLGGSYVNAVVTILNVMIVMSLSGLWHGAAVNFIIWGLYHGILLALYHIYKSLKLPSFPSWIAIPLTFLAVSLGWIFFFARISIAKIIILKLISWPFM